MANSDRYRRDEPYGRDERGFVDRATDEVRSWFGDDDADVRRRRDDRDERGDVYTGAQGRVWHDRGREWADRASLDDRRQQRVFPELADDRGGRDRVRRGEGYDRSGWERDGGWDAGRRDSWPEDRGDVTPRHGMGPSGGWRDWRGAPMGASETGGWHVGKGPSGYTRSDERIREDVCDRLTDDPYVDATNIEVAVQGGEVTLSGVVERRDEKRRAEDVVERVSGVREVSNRLRIGTGVAGGLGAATSVPTARS